MKIKLHQLSTRHRHTLLLGLLVASAPLASAALAEGVGDPAKRKAPRRLPAVTATIPADPIQTKRHALATSAEVAACSAEAALNGKSDTSQAATDHTVGIRKDPPARWLRSSTSTASAEVARRLIAQATREYGVGASLSAETSAWTAIRWAAESVDLAQRENGTPTSSDAGASALDRLQRARQAIREARDFSGMYGSVDAEAITRMAKSHLTEVLDSQPTQGLSATDAADRYLDNARVQLAPIAAQSVEAAQAMDLLAAIYLRRADAQDASQQYRTLFASRRPAGTAPQCEPCLAAWNAFGGCRLGRRGTFGARAFAVLGSGSRDRQRAGQSSTPLGPG